MIDWIKNTIDPPGVDKKNRGSIFSTIAEIMSRVSNDAKKAFQAHFPYLADDKKLEEHGKALGIPHLMHDKPGEFRDRVTAASFFLMKAGERGFIMDLLEARFEDRFQVIEKFLQLQVKVADLTEDEKAWLFELLDSLINPVVLFELSEWFHYVDECIIRDLEDASYLLKHRAIDSFQGGIFYDGTHKYDGSNKHGVGQGIHDEFGFGSSLSVADTVESTDVLKLGMRRHHTHNGNYKYDGSVAYDSMVLSELD